ncbi:MAG: response regulator [Desulfobulbaceae bacterium]|nr:response regulator [Desulfobulbaceae bacterium]HIJ77939.1 response regulator [Deltaproteobacteria bacterium]
MSVQKLNELKILIVDDFELPRRMVRNMLYELGCDNHENLTEATDGLKAFEVLENRRIDLIICDWIMPNMTGIELLKKVRATEALAKIPFIMVTAETEKEHIMEAIKAGVSQYVVKPFTTEVLCGKIKSALKL